MDPSAALRGGCLYSLIKRYSLRSRHLSMGFGGFRAADKACSKFIGSSRCVCVPPYLGSDENNRGVPPSTNTNRLIVSMTAIPAMTVFLCVFLHRL